MLVGRLLSSGNVRQTTLLVSCLNAKLNNDTENLCHILAFNGNAKFRALNIAIGWRQ